MGGGCIIGGPAPKKDSKLGIVVASACLLGLIIVLLIALFR